MKEGELLDAIIVVYLGKWSSGAETKVQSI